MLYNLVESISGPDVWMINLTSDRKWQKKEPMPFAPRRVYSFKYKQYAYVFGEGFKNPQYEYIMVYNMNNNVWEEKIPDRDIGLTRGETKTVVQGIGLPGRAIVVQTEMLLIYNIPSHTLEKKIHVLPYKSAFYMTLQAPRRESIVFLSNGEAFFVDLNNMDGGVQLLSRFAYPNGKFRHCCSHGAECRTTNELSFFKHYIINNQ